jgi:MarR family transcriptional regulator, organic hydroperoxide resistance regulator
MEIASEKTVTVSEAGVVEVAGMAPEEARHEAGSPEAGDGEPGPGGCARELAPGNEAGWMVGNPADGIPADAPLHMLLLAASKAMGAFYAGTVVQAGLRVSPAGLGVLRVLLAGDGLKSSDVAARGWSSPGTLTAVVNTLVREGYVERRRDAGDRRVVRLYVTDKGRRTCEDYYVAAGQQWRAAFGFVSPADEPVIRRFFTDMIGHFSELIRKERGR